MLIGNKGPESGSGVILRHRGPIISEPAPEGLKMDPEARSKVTVIKRLRLFTANLRYAFGDVDQVKLIEEAIDRIEALEAALALIEGNSKDDWAQKLATEVLGLPTLK